MTRLMLNKNFLYKILYNMNSNIRGLSFHIVSQINQDYDNQLSTSEKRIVQRHEITVNGQIEKAQ